MKKNSKGFFLAETIVVIALVTTVMAFVYPNVTNLYDNYKNRTNHYDQTEDLYLLRAYYEANYETIAKATCTDASKCNVEDIYAENNTLGLKQFANDKIDNTNAATSVGSYSSEGLIKVYITGYMTDVSSDNYNFNKYLKRLKKTTYDKASYRLIGEFNGGKYASIKIDNPNPNRSENLGGK